MSKSLVLPNITKDDEGKYYCKAEIESTKYKNASINIIVFGKYSLDLLKT